MQGIFRSGNGGGSWASLDLPVPTIHPGGQAGTHLSFVASRANPNVVFIGGDRQNTPFPNDVGASDFSGRLFRIDASLAPGSQAQHLTHSNALGAPGGGTANNSAPHADSRVMVIDANGEVIEGDDGGVYRRTIPANNTGIWRSVIGNLVSTEFHGIAFDSNTNTVFGGDPGQRHAAAGDARQPGVVEHQHRGRRRRGDRRRLAPRASPCGTASFQNLGQFRRRTYNSAGTLLSTQTPTLTVTAGPAFGAQFVHAGQGQRARRHPPDPGRVERRLRVVQPRRHDRAGRPGVGQPQRDRLRRPAPRRRQPRRALRRLGHPGAGADGRGGSATPPPPIRAATVTGLALNPEDWQEAFATDATSVFRTTDAGASWTNVTHNLQTFAPGLAALGGVHPGRSRAR